MIYIQDLLNRNCTTSKYERDENSLEKLVFIVSVKNSKFTANLI